MRGKGDLPLLIAHFLKKFAKEVGKEIRGWRPDALALLESYPFAGNVRELENIIERAVVLVEGGVIQKEDLELTLPEGSDSSITTGFVPQSAESVEREEAPVAGVGS